ncbi:hypothetical protein HZC31_03800 [Candidatus Woesearchaeota archaeon]|nr:hypothetical protein [Candidatus Woesearchaeota archaeon]
MWSSPLLRNLERDLDRARQYVSLLDGISKEDLALRREDVERMRTAYASNTYAAELFNPYLQTLQQKEKTAPKKAKEHTPTLPHPAVVPEVIVRRRPSVSADHSAAPHASLEEMSGNLDGILEEIDEISYFANEGSHSSSQQPLRQSSAALEIVEPDHFVLPASLRDSKILEQLLRYYNQKGVVGEEKNLILQTLCVTSGLHFCLSGPSGSGKTKIIDALVALLDPADIYKLEFASETALMNDVDRINSTRILYIPEVQKAYSTGGRQKTPMIAEIMKGITEGRDVTRRVTVGREDVREYTLKSGLTVITSLAFENIFHYDEETARRFIALVTDTTEEHKEAVRQAKAKSAFYKGDSDVDVQLEKDLRMYVGSLLHHPFSLHIADPFAQDVASYIPLTQRSASFQAQYYGLVGAAARFSHNRRYVAQLDHASCESASSQERTVFVSIEDHQLIYGLYHDQMLANMQQLDKTEGDQKHVEIVRKKIEEQNGLPWEEMIHSAQQRMTTFYPAHAGAWVAQEQKIQGS